MTFLLLWALSFSACVTGGFRHYAPIANCEPSVAKQTFACTGTDGTSSLLPFTDPAADKLVCFRKTEFVAHEQACHAK